MKLRIAVMVVASGTIALPGGCAAGSPGDRGALPGILIEHATRTLQVEGRVCIEGGILEYLAVAGDGKEYESVFALDCRPSHLQVAMLIAGYRAGEVAPHLRGDLAPGVDPAANNPPSGAPKVRSPSSEYFAKAGSQPTRVRIDVEVQRSDGTWRRRPVEHYLKDRGTGQTPPRFTWAFTGSYFQRDAQTGVEFFMADAEKSLIALWYDPTALLNLTQDVGNPYRGDVSGLAVNAAKLPRKDTPIRLILRPAEASGK